VRQRLKGLDVLRCIALLLVFASHNEQHSAHFLWINEVLIFLGGGGWIGVDLFFVNIIFT